MINRIKVYGFFVRRRKEIREALVRGWNFETDRISNLGEIRVKAWEIDARLEFMTLSIRRHLTLSDLDLLFIIELI